MVAAICIGYTGYSTGIALFYCAYRYIMAIISNTIASNNTAGNGGIQGEGQKFSSSRNNGDTNEHRAAH